LRLNVIALGYTQLSNPSIPRQTDHYSKEDPPKNQLSAHPETKSASAKLMRRTKSQTPCFERSIMQHGKGKKGEKKIRARKPMAR
jgi:hypothetical protein